MNRPKVYTLCGSSRFPDAFHIVNAHLSMQGHVVISLGLFGHADQPMGARFLTSDGNEQTTEKQSLDQLHFRKIDISDGIFVINVGGYVGSSTKREIAYAQSQGKSVEYLFPSLSSLSQAPEGSGNNGSPGEDGGREDDWRNDPAGDERWNAGVEFAQLQLCAVLGVDPKSFAWDGATETLEGDVQVVVQKALSIRFGEDWPDLPKPTLSNPQAEEGL
jgi:hypothetical protein